MASPADQNNASEAPLEVESNPSGVDSAAVLSDQADDSQTGAHPDGIVVADASVGLKADLTVLELEDLLGLRLNDDDAAGRQGNSLADLEKLL